jgi:signal transduction histidine kinase
MTQTPGPKEPARILVIDDEGTIRAFVSDVLREKGYEVDQAMSGEEGVSLLGTKPYDLALVDLQLPGMDGMTVVRQAKAKRADSAFVIMTGHGSVESAIEALREGVADFLPKPFGPKELLRVVDRVLEHRRVLRENLALRESLALYEVVKAIAASADLDETLGLIVQTVKQETKAEQVVAFIRGEGDELLPAAGTEDTPPDEDLIKFAQTVLASPRSEGRPGMVTEPRGPEGQGMRMGGQLRAKDKTVGVLVADHLAAGGVYQSYDLLADIAAIAIHKAQLVASLEESLHRIEEQQAQLIQSSKLSIIGEMAAGIAHEIRNPLAAITLGCELLVAEAEEKAGGQTQTETRALETVLAASKRLADVVDNLVGFSRKQGPTKGPVEVAQLLSKTKSLVRYHISKSHVQWVETISGDGQHILGNEGQLQQVLLNLILNACDAMPQGGVLTFSTAPAELSGMEPGRAGVPALALSVRDSGAGIPPEALRKVFEPFFTTKGERGTGLGLVISRNIIQEHSGILAVESESGKGTTFTITLPLFSEKDTPPTPS